jgi:hypothetical protein
VLESPISDSAERPDVPHRLGFPQFSPPTGSSNGGSIRNTTGRANPTRGPRLLGQSLGLIGLIALLGSSGCAGPGKKWQKKPDPPLQAALTPPSVEGSEIRTQDASKLTRRVGPKKANGNATTQPGDTPKVAWSGPAGAAAGPPNQVVPLPEPPQVPADALAQEPGPSGAGGAAATRGAVEPPRIAQSAASASPTTEPTQPANEGLPVVLEPGAAEAAAELARIRALINQAKARLGQSATYQTRLRRQERVGATLQPAEEVLLSIRREPFAVRLEWPTGPSKGREVLYSRVDTDGKLQINQPGSLMPRMTLNPDSPLVLRNSRHPISEAGFDVLLRNLENSLRPHEDGTATVARLSCEGPVTVPEIGRPCHKITEVRRNGETWLVCLDAESLLPVLVRGSAPDGALLELYQFGNIRLNVPELSTAAAFSPEARWGKGGVLGRLARSGSDSAEAPATSTR